MKYIPPMILLLFVMNAALAAPPGDTSNLPVPNVMEQVASFLDKMTDKKKFSFVEQLYSDAFDNKDVAVAKNLIDFGTAAKKGLKADVDPAVTDELNKLLNKSNEQIAEYSDLTADVLVPAFKELITGDSRYTVLHYWTNLVDTQTDARLLRKLLHFFQVAKDICTAAKDVEYVIREAAIGENKSNLKIIEVQKNTPAFEVPVKNIPKSVLEFKDLGVADRFLQLSRLVEDHAKSTDAQGLVSLVNYAKALLKDVFNVVDPAQVKNQEKAEALLHQSILLLAKNGDLSIDDQITYFQQLRDQAERFTVILFWGEKIKDSKDTQFLLKLARLFTATGDTSKAKKDEDSTIRESSQDLLKTYHRLIELLPPVPFDVPIKDVAARVKTYRDLDIPSRFLIVKKLSDDYAQGTDSKSLVSILDFARQIKKDVLSGAGDAQAFIVQQNEILINQSVNLLAINSELSAEELVSYLQQVTGGQDRHFQVIHSWVIKVSPSRDTLFLQKLGKYFTLARRYINTTDDADFVVREAMAGEKAVKERVKELGGR